MLLGVVHPHTMWVQSVHTAREPGSSPNTDRDRSHRKRGDEEKVSDRKGRKRRWGSSDTGNGERMWQRKSNGWKQG